MTEDERKYFEEMGRVYEFGKKFLLVIMLLPALFIIYELYKFQLKEGNITYSDLKGLFSDIFFPMIFLLVYLHRYICCIIKGETFKEIAENPGYDEFMRLNEASKKEARKKSILFRLAKMVGLQEKIYGD